MLLNAVPYTCSACRRVTMGKSHLVAVTCQHCGRIDLGTEIARDHWRTVLEIRQRMVTPAFCRAPDAPVVRTGSGVAIVVLAALASLALCALALWGGR